jgi:predicted CXXCH cytochrome family protein
VFSHHTLAAIGLAFLSCVLPACKKSEPARQGTQLSHSTPADYVGSAACVGCHRKEYEAWRGSHHELAMQPAVKGSVLGAFEDRKLEHFGVVTRFFRRGEEYWVETQNGEGKPQAFRIEYTFGVYPLQQYLVAFPGGRYQALTMAWDSRSKADGGQRWFHLQPDEPIRPDDPLHWTGPYHNWNSHCSECHSTGLRKNYDVANNTYRTTWTDINVACEGCHGPGSQHLVDARARLPAGSLAPVAQWMRHPQAFTAQPAGARDDRPRMSRQLDVCGTCHSRRQVIIGPDEARSFPVYYDGYVLSLATPPLYHADGQIHDEDFELGSFLQSKMHARGVECSNCHDPHSLRLKAPGNGVCAQCHNPAVFDTRAHHHHDEGSQGTLCADCHMPVTTYMVLDRRRDHSLRIPRPDLSVKFGTPNACTNCHEKQGAAWAANRMQEWLRADGKSLAPHFSDELASPESSNWLRLAANTSSPGIARASALELLTQRPSARTLAEAGRQLRDTDPLVRRAAVINFQVVDLPQRLESLWPLARDPAKSVRMQVAQLLAGVDLASLPDDKRAAVSACFAEFVSTMSEVSDMPGNSVNLGLFYTNRGETQLAESAYRQALRVDRQYIPAYLNLADLYRQQGREDESLDTLENALRLSPEAPAIHHAMGLQRVRARAYGEALGHLKRAHELAPNDVGYGYVYAIALFDMGSSNEAIKILQALSAAHPEDVRVRQALVDFLGRRGRE